MSPSPATTDASVAVPPPGVARLDPRLPSDLLTAVLALSLWISSGSLLLACVQDLGPHPVRRVAIGLLLACATATALWRRRWVERVLQARPGVVVLIAVAQLAAAIADGLVGGAFVSFSLTSIGLAVVAARTRTVWLCVSVLVAGYSAALLATHSPSALADDGDLGGAVGAIVSYPVAALLFLGLRVRFTRFEVGVEATLGDIRAGGPAFTPALGGAMGHPPLALPAGRSAQARLTVTERRVIEGLAAGIAPKQLAYEWGVATSTIRTHIKNAKRKTGVRSLRELAALPARPDWAGSADGDD